MDFDKERIRFNQETADLAVINMITKRAEKAERERDALARQLAEIKDILTSESQYSDLNKAIANSYFAIQDIVLGTDGQAETPRHAG